MGPGEDKINMVRHEDLSQQKLKIVRMHTNGEREEKDIPQSGSQAEDREVIVRIRILTYGYPTKSEKRVLRSEI